MPNSPASIDHFLQQVLDSGTGPVLGPDRQTRQTHGYLCPSASDLAVHLILELYDQGSSPSANITRISGNLELAAEQLLYLSRRVRALGAGGQQPPRR